MELIENSFDFVNPMKEREIDLRGNKIPLVENLGATKDRYHTIDLSDNEIKQLENFPILQRLEVLLLANNRISRIEQNLHLRLANLRVLSLAGNSLSTVASLEPIFSFRRLELLVLMGNPLCKAENWREFVAFSMPTLGSLDFYKITQKERLRCRKLFIAEDGSHTDAYHQIRGTKAPEAQGTFEPGVVPAKKPHASHLTPEQSRAIREAIEKTASFDEIYRLEHILRAGNVP